MLSSKNCKEIWKVVHRILKPYDNTLKVGTNKLNKYFNETATGKSMNKKALTSLIDSFNYKGNKFQLQSVTYKNIDKCKKMIRNDCSKGCDHIPDG